MSSAPRENSDQAVRRRLLLAATELFARKGYAATSVREIVDAARVTKPALYYYFGSKEGIYLELMNEALAEYHATVASALAEGGTVRERITRLVDQVLGLILTHLDIVKVLNSTYYGPAQGSPQFDFEVIHQSFQDVLLGLIAEGMANGELRQADATDVMWAIVGTLEIVQNIHLCHPEIAPGREGLRRILDVVFEGIAAPAAERES